LVTTTADDGAGSLRQAILDSNAAPGPNVIDFDIPGAGVRTVKVGETTGSPLPWVTNAVTIDAYSQPGSRSNSLAQGDDAVLLIQLDGSLLPVGDGLDIFSSDVTVRGLAIDLFPNTGVVILGPGVTGDTVAGNFVGVDPTGTFAEGNGWSGISLTSGTTGATIGGTAPADRNISSGNGNNGVGIYSAGAGNVVEGNSLGTDATGTAAVPNAWAGVTVVASSGNLIGGTTPGTGNVISGNNERGVDFYDASSGNAVEGNLIGTDVTGSFAIGNHWEGVADNGIGSNVVGGTAPGAGNVISGNFLAGVGIWVPGSTGNVIAGNLIGTDRTGSFAVGNQGDGVAILTGGNTVGGTTPAARNVISGNAGDGVGIWSPGADGNVVEGNFIGTDATGSFAVANQGNGVTVIWSASGNTVGGATAGAGNVISGNAGHGVLIAAPGTTGNVVEGNLIGLAVGGDALGNAGDGVRIDWGASGNTVGGTAPGAGNVIAANGVKGVELTGPGDTGNVVEGNLIGTDPTGTSAQGNQAGGVSINGGATDNTIGGTTTAARNVISGNGDHGVEVFDPGTSGNVIEGDFIGTDVTGTRALGNTLDGVGVFLGATDNTVGGTTAGAGNVISSNGADGVEIYGGGTTGTLVAGNDIGTDLSGSVALGNTLDGVGIHAGASGNRVGGYGGALTRNIISGNGQYGVSIAESGTSDNVVEGNFIGTDATGTAGVGNAVDGVSISQGASDNAVGGVVAAARNLISGNGLDGVGIFDSGTSTNAVAGNYIGTDVTGARALGNSGDGVFLGATASGNVIGGAAPGVANVISGNRHDGVVIRGAGTTANGVGGNFIGTDATGTKALGNLIDGVEILASATGNVIGGPSSAARNVISGNHRNGVNVHDRGTDSNAVSANYIGTDVTGRKALANKRDGVDVSRSARNNLIGGEEAGEGNVISGNAGSGVAIFAAASGTLVEGNLIGTSAAGSTALANHLSGVAISGSAKNTIVGGTTALTRNVISGNAGDGFDITGKNTIGNVVEGNYVGTDATGRRALMNALDGVRIADSAGHNVVGGTASGAGNLISGNGLDGVSLNETGLEGNLVQGNAIGTNAAGTAGLGNGGDGVNVQLGDDNLIGGTAAGAANVIAYNRRNGVEVIASKNVGIRQNSIFANAALGIALENGANQSAPAPALTSAVSSATGTTVQGTLTAAPNRTYTLELFSNTTLAANGTSQGRVYLGSVPVTTDASGHASFTVTLSVAVSAGEFLTATATDSSENTSEFSAPVIVG
jgi:hypothetical protein